MLIVSMLQFPVSAIKFSINNTFDNISGNPSFDKNDILVAVARHVKSEYTATNLPMPIFTQPLYNLSDDIIAYKVVMTDGSYIVVNANRENPVIIEFSDPGMVSTNNIKLTSVDKRQYYLAPGIVSEKADSSTNKLIIENSTFSIDKESDQVKNLETTFATMLATPNAKLAAQHKLGLELLDEYLDNCNAQSRSDSIYEAFSFLLSVSELPTDTYTSRSLQGLNLVFGWGTTSEFSDLPNVHDHCAATSAFNIMLFYRAHMGSSVGQFRDALFSEIHSFMDNGPVFPWQYRSRFDSYITESTSYTLHMENLSDTWANYKQYIRYGYMNIMCLLPALNMGHMVNGVGYREYSSGNNYCMIINNWDEFGYVYTLFGTSLVDLFSIRISEGDE